MFVCALMIHIKTADFNLSCVLSESDHHISQYLDARACVYARGR